MRFVQIRLPLEHLAGHCRRFAACPKDAIAWDGWAESFHDGEHTGPALQQVRDWNERCDLGNVVVWFDGVPFWLSVATIASVPMEPGQIWVVTPEEPCLETTMIAANWMSHYRPCFLLAQMAYKYHGFDSVESDKQRTRNTEQLLPVLEKGQHI
jgi:hypothetical protein